jgi:hypothetical protein
VFLNDSQNGIIIFDAERLEMPAVKSDPEEKRLCEEVNQRRRELYTEESAAKAARRALPDPQTDEHHRELDAVSDRVTGARLALQLAERELHDHRERRRKERG